MVGSGIMGTQLSQGNDAIALLANAGATAGILYLLITVLGPAQWLSEGIATSGLVLTIVLGLRFRQSAIPALVASYIFAAYWFTASTSFANPAVTVARALTKSFAGIRPDDVLAFVAAQCAGALLAWVASSLLLDRETRRETV